MVTEVKTSQIKDAVCSSLAALTAEKDPQGRGMRIVTLLAAAGTEGGEGWGDGTGGGSGDRGC